MKSPNFEEAVAKILKDDPRYAPDAYQFARETLDFTAAILSKPARGAERHISGQELLEGMRKYALQEYGAIAMTVLNTWGVFRCEDLGQIIFNLVDKGFLRKTEPDSIHDFDGGYDFETAFRKPFLPGDKKAGAAAHHTDHRENVARKNPKGVD